MSVRFALTDRMQASLMDERHLCGQPDRLLPAYVIQHIGICRCGPADRFADPSDTVI
jgi:hypothetical protein